MSIQNLRPLIIELHAPDMVAITDMIGVIITNTSIPIKFKLETKTLLVCLRCDVADLDDECDDIKAYIPACSDTIAE